MIEALKELGEVMGDAYKYCDMPWYVSKDKQQFEINIRLEYNATADRYTYKDTIVVDYDRYNYYKYFFREIKAGKSCNYAPSGKVSEYIYKTFLNKMLGWFYYTYKRVDILELLKKEGQAYNDVMSIKLNNKASYFMVVTVNGVYPYEYAPFKDAIMKKLMDTRAKVSGSGQCFVCHQNTQVIGNYGPYACYSIDKKCYINGFVYDDAWHNFPLCHDCCDFIFQGKKVMEQYMNFSLGGVDYYVIPLSVFDYKSNLKSIVNTYKNLEEKKQHPEELKQMAFSEEYDVLQLMSEQNDSCVLNFMFVERQQSKFLIHLYVEDMCPSRIKAIVDALEAVNEIDFIKHFKLNFNFGCIRMFCEYNSEKSKKSVVEFIEMINKTLKGIPISYQYLMWLINKKIVKAMKDSYKNDNENYIWTVLKSFAMLEFYANLKMTKEVREVINITVNNDMTEGIQDFFNERSKSFKNTDAAAVFLMGVLCHKLVTEQKSLSNNRNGSFKAPFMKQLKGFRMTEKDVIGLYAKMVDKLVKYDENYKYQNLQAILSDLLTQSNNELKLTNNELNYYFMLGFTLGKMDVFGYQGEDEDIPKEPSADAQDVSSAA